MKPVIVTKELVSEGLGVMRGKDWGYSTNQDGGAGKKGIVISVGEPKGWCKVRWDNGSIYHYAIGSNGKYDLYVYVPGFYDTKPQEVRRLTGSNVVYGLKVKLRNDASFFARSYLEKAELIVRGFDLTGVKFNGFDQTFKYESFDICENQSVVNKVDETEKQSMSYTVAEAVYKFRTGDIVYFKGTHNSWTKGGGIVENKRYEVSTVTPGGSMTIGLSGIWFSQDQFMSEAEWHNKRVKEAYATSKPNVQMMDMGSLQKNVVAIAENSKPNKNSTDVRVNKHPEPIKVRRPISTIQGSKGRSRAVITSRRSSTGSRISHY